MKWSKVMCVVGLAMALGDRASAQMPPPKDKLGCQGVPEVEWNGTPLVNASDIRAVQEIRPDAPVSEAETVVQRAGARVVLRAQPGMTAEWLQRIASCHMGRVAVASPTTLTSSPLDIKGAQVTVQSTGDGFSVDITSADVKIAREILTRTKAIVPVQPVLR